MNPRLDAYLRDVLPESGLRLLARSVVLTVGLFANRDGVAWPSEPLIGQLLGVNPGNVRRTLPDIESTGILQIWRTPGKSNIYVFPIASVIHTPRGGARGQTVSPRAVARDTPRGAARLPRAVLRAEVDKEVDKKHAPSCGCEDCLHPVGCRCSPECVRVDEFVARAVGRRLA